MNCNFTIISRMCQIVKIVIRFVDIVKIKCDTYLYSHTPYEESLSVKYFMPQIIVLIFLQNVNVKMVVKVAKKISTWMSSFNVRVKTFHVICRNIRDTHRDSLWITTSPIFVRLFDLNMNILIKPTKLGKRKNAQR